MHKGTRTALTALVCLALVATACGSRLSDREIRAQSVVSGGDRNAVGTGAGDGASADVGAGAAAAPAATGTAGTSTAGAAGGQPAGAAAGARSGGAKVPIVVGYVGWLSGSGGETISPNRDMYIAWMRSVNARGGINGRPVQVLVGDHGGNDSQAVSIARDFVENKGAVALVLAGGGPALVQYAQSKGVPVIGSVVTGGNWTSTPMAFPPYGTDEAQSWGTARVLKRSGLTKVAVVYCAESSDCQAGEGRFQRHAAAEGVQIVSSQRYTVTAPDYTAECLQMKGAGAQAVYPTGDTGSMIRMAASCARQGFRPTWISPTMSDAVRSNPNFEGAMVTTPTFPWFARSGIPAIDEYAAAMRTYAPSRVDRGNTFLSWAWTSAKLLQRAVEMTNTEKVTSQDLLNALWSMKGETVYGLAPGATARTYTRDQPTPETFCVFEGKLQGGNWTLPNGLDPICR